MAIRFIFFTAICAFLLLFATSFGTPIRAEVIKSTEKMIHGKEVIKKSINKNLMIKNGPQLSPCTNEFLEPEKQKEIREKILLYKPDAIMRIEQSKKVKLKEKIKTIKKPWIPELLKDEERRKFEAYLKRLSELELKYPIDKKKLESARINIKKKILLEE